MTQGVYVRTEWHKSRIKGKFVKGQPSPRKGTHPSQSSTQKMIATKKRLFAEGKIKPTAHWTGKTGEASPRWNGGKSASKRRSLAHRRSYGFEPLNEYFEGADAHHIDKVHVLFIPRELHRSIKHSLDKQETMNKINTRAICWLLGVD